MGVRVLWPLAFLALIPVILLLYFLKQQVKQKDFSSIMLWKEAYRSVEATRPWEKLRKNILLFLQIAAVLLFILALMGFWLSAAGKTSPMTVLVLDNSAGMGTIYEDDVTRLETAKEMACSYVDRMAEGSTVCVIAGNQQAALVLGGSSDHLEVKRRIRGIEQTDLAGDLTVSLGLVQSCIAQAEEADVVFYTDTAFEMGDMKARVESLYSQVENCGVTDVNYKLLEERIQVLVQVMNYGEADSDREINLYGVLEDGSEELLDIQALDVTAGEADSAFFELDIAALPDNLVAFRGELNERDGLLRDNEAWCPLNQQKENRVLILTKSNLFLDKAFSNISGVSVYRTSDLGVLDTQEGQGYDLYVFDGMLPENLPAEGNLMFWNCAPEGITSDAEKVSGAKLQIQDTEVTSYSNQASFGVNESYAYQVPTWGVSFLVSEGESCGFYGTYDGQRMAVIGFSLSQTDLGLKAEFPIMISEMSGFLLDSSLTEKSSFTAGESILIHGSSSGSDLELIRPDRTMETIPVSQAAGVYIGGNQLGLYRVSQTSRDQEKVQLFAVQFPGTLEAQVTPAQSTSADGAGISGGAAGVRELRSLFLILLLLVIGAEWIIYTKTS